MVNDTATMDYIQKEGGVYYTLAQGEVAYTKEKHGYYTLAQGEVAYTKEKHGEVLGIEITEYRDYLIKK